VEEAGPRVAGRQAPPHLQRTTWQESRPAQRPLDAHLDVAPVRAEFGYRLDRKRHSVCFTVFFSHPQGVLNVP